MSERTAEEIREAVRERYAAAATQGTGCGGDGASCCGPGPALTIDADGVEVFGGSLYDARRGGRRARGRAGRVARLRRPDRGRRPAPGRDRPRPRLGRGRRRAHLGPPGRPGRPRDRARHDRRDAGARAAQRRRGRGAPTPSSSRATWRTGPAARRQRRRGDLELRDQPGGRQGEGSARGGAGAAAGRAPGGVRRPRRSGHGRGDPARHAGRGPAAWPARSPGAEFEEALAAAGFEDVTIDETHRVHAHAASAIVRARVPG